MSITDYLLDSVLVLLVLLQLKERELTLRTMVRPLVIVAVALVSYLHGIPTAGNDLLLVACLAAIGATIGVASGRATVMRTDEHGHVLARAGWASAAWWVAGMGGRFAFVWWISHTGATSIAHFSAAHSITSDEAWTVALLAMALCEVCGRTLVMAARRQRLQGRPGAAQLVA